MSDPWDTLKLLSDPTRLRIINLLTIEELSVAELQDILNMGQSRISSHLALLRQGGLVLDRKDGKRSYYTLNPAPGTQLSKLISAACDSIRGTREAEADRNHLKRIVQKRRQIQEQYFNSVAGRLGKNYCPGRSWEAIGHFLLHMVPSIKVADLGAGEGLIGQLLARHAEQVVAIDSSPKMIEIGSELAEKNGIQNLEYKLGDIEDIPLENQSVDLALLSQALHHAQKPAQCLAEAFRILKPGGQLCVIDLLQHDFEKARELYADIWLGFSENDLYQLIQAAGFTQVEVTPVAREEVEPNFVTLLATGLKPSN